MPSKMSRHHLLPNDEPFESKHKEQFAREYIVAHHFYAQTRVFFDRLTFLLNRERAVALAQEVYRSDMALRYGGDFYYCGAWKRTFSFDLPPHVIGGVGDSERLKEDPLGKLPSFSELMRQEVGAEEYNVAEDP